MSKREDIRCPQCGEDGPMVERVTSKYGIACYCNLCGKTFTVVREVREVR